MRYSKQREQVLQVLKSTKIHPDAEWVYEQVRKQIPNISMGTVYRNLKELESCGQILMFTAGGSIMHFDGDNSQHAHFVCKECGQITDIFASSGLRRRLMREGNEVDSERLIFFGRCSDCCVHNKQNVQDAHNRI